MIFALVKRNLKLYFRDKASIFFSMLGVLLIILVYVLFLGNMVSGIADSFSDGNSRFFMDSWIMAGVIASTTMTTALAGFGTMIDDRAKKIVYDFHSSPIPRSTLVLSYILSSVTVALIMSLLTLALAQGYIVIYGGQFLSFRAFAQVLGLIVLSVAASSSFVFFLVAFIKSQNAFGTLSSLIGTLIGFLTGIYVPIGNLPTAIQWIIKVFPVSHAAAAIRQTMMNEAVAMEYVPDSVKLFMGLEFQYGDYTLPLLGNILVLVATLVLFFSLSVLIMKKYKEKS